MRSSSRYIVPAKRVAPGLGDNKLSVVILSANMGKRMKSYGPKALFKLLNESTIVDKQLQTIWSVYPNADIILVIGFEARKIRQYVKQKYPVRFIYNPLWEETNVMYSLSLGLQACITNSILIMHGDLVFNEEALRGMTEDGSRVLIDSSQWFKDEEVGLVYNQQNKIVTHFSYGLPTKWGQIVYLEEKELQIFERVAHNHELSQRWFFYEALNSIIKDKGRLRIHEPIGLRIAEVDTIKDLKEAKQI